jgi:hypothetical protein
MVPGKQCQGHVELSLRATAHLLGARVQVCAHVQLVCIRMHHAICLTLPRP